LKDIFQQYSVKDNPELDEELNKLDNELLSLVLPDSGSGKYSFNFYR